MRAMDKLHGAVLPVVQTGETVRSLGVRGGTVRVIGLSGAPYPQ